MHNCTKLMEIEHLEGVKELGLLATHSRPQSDGDNFLTPPYQPFPVPQPRPSRQSGKMESRGMRLEPSKTFLRRRSYIVREVTMIGCNFQEKKGFDPKPFSLMIANAVFVLESFQIRRILSRS